ncbi:MAG: LytTR family transcriptional regulator DNA-binding domain-containing protein [Bacteroidales bacterium]|nr:LytTR family transcriptional regulator DNA-binding domain-containing protein [Bacteroidales bacterium]
MPIDIVNTVYIHGDIHRSYCYGDDTPVKIVRRSLYSLEKELKQEGFMRINDFTLINTKFRIGTAPGRIITLKGGSKHKVSRQFWKHFM